MNYDEKQKIITATRLKECRNEKGLSHENLAKELKKIYNLEISALTLKNYEIIDEYHTKFESGYGMNIKYLFTFADFFEVSTDYLLGRTPIKTADTTIQAIGYETGLSEEAVVALNNAVLFQDVANNEFYAIDALNHLFQDGVNPPNTSFFSNLADYFYTAKKDLEKEVLKMEYFNTANFVELITAEDLEEIILRRIEKELRHLRELAQNEIKEKKMKGVERKQRENKFDEFLPQENRDTE